MGPDDINEKPGTPLAKFFSKFTRKRSSRTNSKVSDDNALKNEDKIAKDERVVDSSPSRFSTYFRKSRLEKLVKPYQDSSIEHSSPSRFSTFFRKSRLEKLVKPYQDSSIEQKEKKVEQNVVFKTTTPRSAKSENDLRYVTVGRGSCVQQTPLAGASIFQSENDLSSPSIGTPLEKVPSYVKISCTLNGYGTPRKAANSSTCNPMLMGKGLVERRLMQYRDNPAVPNTPLSQPIRGVSSKDAANMGANGSVPSPVSGLINKFNKMHICMDEKPQTTDVKPHMIIIDTQPQQQNFSQHSDVCLAMEKISDEYNQSIKSNAVIQAADSTTSGDQEIVMARSGSVFRKVLNDTRLRLEQLCEKASDDLETVENMPEEAADAIRMAIGKAKLLNKKKIGKFESLVGINLGEEKADKYATNEDLEGYWALVEIELSDIHSFFQTVEAYRNSGWKLVLQETIKRSSLSNVVSSVPTKTAQRKSVQSTVRTEEQKRKAQEITAKRKAMLEEAKAKARMLQSTADKASADSFMQTF